MPTSKSTKKGSRRTATVAKKGTRAKSGAAAKTGAARVRRAARPTDPNDASVLRDVRTLTPYLSVADARGAIEWYKKVFGAKLPVEPMALPDGKILHATLKIGDSLLFVSDIFPGADVVDPARAGASVTVNYYRPNAGHVWERAVENGAKVTMPYEDQFWGDVYGKIIDPFGHSWAISRKSKLKKAELEKLREKAMGAFGAS